MIWDLPWVILPTTWTLPNFCSAAMARMTHLSALVAPAGKVVVEPAAPVVAAPTGPAVPPIQSVAERAVAGATGAARCLGRARRRWRWRLRWRLRWRWDTTLDPVNAAPTQKSVLPAACEKRSSRA